MSGAKGHNFLDLHDNENCPIKSSYSEGGLWIRYFGHSNLLCTRAIRAIINHTSIREYCLRFFPKEDFSCLYGDYPIETRCHILYKCRRHNNY